MGVIDRAREATRVLIGRRDIIESTVRTSDMWARSGMLANREDIQRATQYNRWVKICTDLTAQAVASRRIRVFREAPNLRGKSAWRTRSVSKQWHAALAKDPCLTVSKFASLTDELEEVTDPTHPINRLLSEINPFYNGFDFIEQTDSHLSLYGNAFWIPVLGEGGWPVELWSTHPLFTQIVPHETRFIDGYLYARDPTEPILFDVSAVIHFHQKRGVTPDPYRGVGNLDAVLVESDLTRLISVHQYSSLERGNQPGLVVSGPGVTPDNKDDIKRILDQEGGPEGAGRSLALVGELTVTQWAQITKEMSYLQTAKDVRDMIFGAWQIPIDLVTSENSNLAKGKVAAPQWELISIGPRARRMTDKFNEQLMPMFEGPMGQRFCVAMDEPELGDIDAEQTGVRANWSAGLIARSEARAELGMDDIDDGEQIFFADTQPLPEPAGIGGLFSGLGVTPPLQLESANGRNVPRPNGTRSANASESGASGQDESRSVELHHADPERGAGAARGDVRTTDAYETSAANTQTLNLSGDGSYIVWDVWPWTDDEHCRESWSKDTKQITGATEIVATERQLIAALSSWFGGITGTVDTRRGFFQAELSQWPDDVRNQIERLFLLGINAAQEELGKEAITSLSDNAVRLLREKERTLIGSLTQTVNERVSSALQQSLEAGEPITDTTMRVREALGPDATNAAAERIARTETANAYGEGRLQQYEADEDVIGKEWHLSSDPCPICLALHAKNKVVGIREEFISPLGKGVWASVRRHPAHPNCRCDVRAVRTEV